MDGLEMLDPASSMTTLTPMSETPSITSPHHQLHGSYHGMNHMMGHHHGGPLGGHTPGMNHYGNHCFFAPTSIFNRILLVTVKLHWNSHSQWAHEIHKNIIGLSKLIWILCVIDQVIMVTRAHIIPQWQRQWLQPASIQTQTRIQES